MILTCPACSTRYAVDPTSIGPEGRRVRCTKCGHVWQQMPPDDMPKSVKATAEDVTDRPPEEAMAASSAAATAASLIAERAQTRAAVKRRRTWPAWVALFIILAALVGAGYYGRDQIVTAVPQTARLYAALAFR